MIKYPKDFLEFWKSYPRRVAKIAAFNMWQRAIKKFGATPQQLIEGANRYAVHVEGKDQQYIKHPSSWLNAGCWEDEYETEKQYTSPQESLKNARIKGFEKTGFWNDDWGQRPTSH